MQCINHGHGPPLSALILYTTGFMTITHIVGWAPAGDAKDEVEGNEETPWMAVGANPAPLLRC